MTDDEADGDPASDSRGVDEAGEGPSASAASGADQSGDGHHNDPDGAADEGSPVSDEAQVFVHLLVGLGLTVLGAVASLFGVIPLLLLGVDNVAGVATGIATSELGYAVVGLLFLVVTGRGIDYLDLDLPGGHREWVVVVGFTVGAFLVRSVAVVAAAELGVQPAESNIANIELPFEVLAAILLPMMLLVVGPAEELLFRGVIQKYLREVASARAAILGAGLLFGGVHVFSLVQSTGIGTVVSLVVITAVGLGLGWLYEYTGSLPAAMLAHGGYNALIVASAVALRFAGGG
jgi:membrane protease YdiL (CAAX protease family)